MHKQSLHKTITRLNMLMSSINKYNVYEAYTLITDTYTGFKDKLPDYTYEKCMLRILSKEYNEDLFKFLSSVIQTHLNKLKGSKEEFMQIYVPYCILKYKYKGCIDKSISFIKEIPEKYKEKIRRIINNHDDKSDKSNRIEIVDYVFPINSTTFTYDIPFPVFSVQDDIPFYSLSTFIFYYNKGIILRSSNVLNPFIQVCTLFVDGKYSECKENIRRILRNNKEEAERTCDGNNKEVDICNKVKDTININNLEHTTHTITITIYRLHIYNMLIYCYINMGMYHEAVFYLDRCIGMSLRPWYFIWYKLLVERLGRVHGPISQIPNNYFNYITSNTLTNTNISINKSLSNIKDLTNILLNKRLYLNMTLESTTENIREIRNMEYDYYTLIKNITRLSKINNTNLYTVLSLFVKDSFLYINYFNKVINTGIDYESILKEYYGILVENKDILKLEQDKNRWWNKRILLDKKMERLMKSVQYDLEVDGVVLLVLDDKIVEFPFEYTDMFYRLTTYRILSVEYYKNSINISDTSVNKLFILDPSLVNTHRRITGRFRNRSDIVLTDIPLIPSIPEIVCYFGHGNGCKYLGDISNRVLLLFGCSSVHYKWITNFRRNGTILKYIKNNRLVMGCLYEVTDKDLDLFSIKLLDTKGDIVENIKKSRREMRLKWLNGCSIVAYGLPYVYK